MCNDYTFFVPTIKQLGSVFDLNVFSLSMLTASMVSEQNYKDRKKNSRLKEENMTPCKHGNIILAGNVVLREDERGAAIVHHSNGTAEESRIKVRAYFDDLRETVNRQEEAGLAVVNNYVREKLLSLRQQQEDMAVLMSQVNSVCLECERALKRSDAEVR